MTKNLITALHVAGPSARLVCRPAGVAHVYVGPSTPSGRFVPRSRRTVCRARTRRLAVTSLLTCQADRRSLCARCSACLDAAPVAARQAAPLSTRDEFVALYAGTSLEDLAAAAAAVETEDQLDYVAHVALVVLDGDSPTQLTEHIARNRSRVHIPTEHELAGRDAWRHVVETGTARRKADARDAWADREARITRLGINNAKPIPEGAPMKKNQRRTP